MSVARSAGLTVKRALDLLIAGAVAVLAAPLMLAIAVSIRLSMGSPVLFRHLRLGKDGREFTLLKFRSMSGQPAGPGQPLDDGERITPLGAFLRRTTLDELPEIVNVLRGDMSVVGPRPLLVDYRDLYSPRQWRRHLMRPGMAGPVVAAGRNSLTWEEKFELDVQYVESWSLWLDMKILAGAVAQVLFRKGISAPGHATMPRFEGARKSGNSEHAPDSQRNEESTTQ